MSSRWRHRPQHSELSKWVCQFCLQTEYVDWLDIMGLWDRVKFMGFWIGSNINISVIWLVTSHTRWVQLSNVSDLLAMSGIWPTVLNFSDVTLMALTLIFYFSVYIFKIHNYQSNHTGGSRSFRIHSFALIINGKLSQEIYSSSRKGQENMSHLSSCTDSVLI